MKCRKCGKHIMQVWGEWSPETPDVTRRGYLCRTCRTGYVEIYSISQQEVIGIEEKDYNLTNERQTSLMEW